MSELFFSHPVSDPVTANREMIQNALMSRKGFFDRFFDRRRDLNSECGYPETNSAAASVEGYKELYDRMPIARRVVEIMPKECWQVQPTVYETEDPEDETEFEKAWDNLSKTLRGEQSWYQDESGSPVWDYLKRADILSGIGHFGLILLGIDDGKMLDQPVDGVVATMQMSDGTVRNKFPSSPVVNSKLPDAVKSEEEALLNTYVKNFSSTDGQYDYSPYGMKANPIAEGIQGTDAQYVGVQLSPSETPSKDGKGRQKRNLVFMRCFDESMVQIVQYEADLRNPRFGKPVMYRVTLNDPREQHGGVGLSTATVRVHWSRVIHIADNLQSSEIFGSPRMRAVLNDLLDLRKIYGASAEGYWKSCFSILQFSTHPQMGGDVDVNVEKIKDAVDNVNNSLQRDLLGLGGAWSTIAPSVVDPTPHIQVRLTAIALNLGCPMRVFMGTEQGVLAGDQDGEAFYLRRVPERQQRTITPRQIIPLVDRLIQMGVLPEPKKTKEDLPTDGGEAVENLGAGTYRRLRKVQVEVYNADTEQIEIQDREVGSTVIKTTGGYSIEWPDMDSMTAKDKAAVLLQRTQAYSAYVSGGLEAMIPPHEFMTEFDSVPDARARQIIDAAAEAHEAQDTMTTAPMVGGRPMAPEEGQDGYVPPEQPEEDDFIENSFCPTGVGGGVDPSCSSNDPEHHAQQAAEHRKTAAHWETEASKIGDHPAAEVYREAAKSSRKVAKKHEKLKKALLEVPAVEAPKISEKNASKIEDLQGKVDSAQAREDAAKARYKALTEKYGSAEEIAARIAKTKAELAASKKRQKEATRNAEMVFNRFCKTGPNGGVDPTCGRDGSGETKHMSDKARIALGSAKRVDKTIQRYAEEHNEPAFARAIGGLSFKDNEPVDIVVGDASGRIKHGVELKTMVDNGNNKITMKQSAMQRKAKWEKANRATFHTVVFDDTAVFNANGPGKHDVSKRRIFYRRGFGSFRVGTMHEVKSMKELKQLMDTPNKKLPDAAKRKN